MTAIRMVAGLRRVLAAETAVGVVGSDPVPPARIQSTHGADSVTAPPTDRS
ncbi:hypothetical protein GCM10010420_15060 [Streptomyces glaucosporus]|uniref:Uncharacterized protein n=1 Tax=Streptomyces glaucosporus TaxID=284044 RepID=A0ABN3HZZ4_9ACTN